MDHRGICTAFPFLLVCGCGGTPGAGGAAATSSSVTSRGGGASATSSGGGAGATATSTSGSATTASSGTGSSTGSAGGGACTTEITYGDAWIRPPSHPAQSDTVAGPVTWDGACTDDGSNSFASLSNGWKPYFTGHGACVMALDTICPGALACTTRVTYGAAWIPSANHLANYDDVARRVYWDRSCAAAGGDSVAVLSNGWAPHFTGASACEMSFEYQGCGGLYQNAVIPAGCADPGVLRNGSEYVVACTSGDDADAFPISTSTDLATWTPAGYILVTPVPSTSSVLKGVSDSGLSRRSSS
jgi:arabinan endo-1,5-alpha-L-arabinosidase